jgi:uncharacterized protein with von Willebrand factor type A (vWA) domain
MAGHDLDELRAAAGVVAFADVLRGLGVPIPVSRIELALEALASIDATQREQAYWALRCALITRADEIGAFDLAFAALWEGDARGVGGSTAPPLPAGERPRVTAGGATAEQFASERPADGSEEGSDARAGRRWSAVERLRDIDFRAYDSDELARASRLIIELARMLPRRRSRRLRPADSGPHLDRRATLRRAMRTEGHPVQLAWRRASSRPRRLVFAIDVSGSMEPYTRPLLMFLQAARQASRNVEAFAFGTRLTRLTDGLAGRRPDAALERVARAVPDWAGGTRIGDNLRRLNDVWGRRGVTRGAIVVIVSDGWERGDPGMLRTQMERLKRTAHRTIWVNPLAGDPDYQPLAAGMATALPYVDVFLPGHNLRSLEALAAVLAESPSGRAGAARRSSSKV